MCCSLFSLHRQTTFILIINDMLHQIMEIYFQIGVTAIRIYIGTDLIGICRVFRIHAVCLFPNIGYTVIITIRPEVTFLHFFIASGCITRSIDNTRFFIRVFQSNQISFVIPILHLRTFIRSTSCPDFSYYSLVYLITTQRSPGIIQYSFISNLRCMTGHLTERLIIRHLHSLFLFFRHTFLNQALIKLRPNTVRPVIGTDLRITFYIITIDISSGSGIGRKNTI